MSTHAAGGQQDVRATFVLVPGAGGRAWYWHRLVPELQRRGRYRSQCPQGTLRSKLFRQGARLPFGHAGRQARLGEGQAAANEPALT